MKINPEDLLQCLRESEEVRKEVSEIVLQTINDEIDVVEPMIFMENERKKKYLDVNNLRRVLFES